MKRIEPRVKVVVVLTKLADDLERLTSKVSRFEEQLDQITSRLKDTLDNCSAGLNEIGPGSLRRARRSVAEARRLASVAAIGASRVELRKNFDGSASVRVDGRLVDLTPKLAVVMESLISDDGSSVDEFVPWKTPGAVMLLLQKRFGEQTRRHTFNQLVHRLRRKLWDQAGLPGGFIQRNRRLGARFGLRRESVTGGHLA